MTDAAEQLDDTIQTTEEGTISPPSEEVRQEHEQQVDPATDPATEHGKVEFDERQQKWINHKLAEERRERQRLEKEREEALARAEELASKIPEPTRPEVPPVPDRYDYEDDTAWQAAIQQRDRVLQEAVEWDTRARYQQEQEQQRQQQRQAEAQQALVEKAKKYDERIDQLGVSREELAQAGQAVAQHFQLGTAMHEFLLTDPHGPAITNYLGNNLMELDKVRQMDPMSAAIYIEKEIREKATRRRPVDTAPDPVGTLQSGSSGGTGYDDIGTFE